MSERVIEGQNAPSNGFLWWVFMLERLYWNTIPIFVHTPKGVSNLNVSDWPKSTRREVNAPSVLDYESVLAQLYAGRLPEILPVLSGYFGIQAASNGLEEVLRRTNSIYGLSAIQ